MENSVLEKIELAINKYDLLDEGDSILVALSGGADSVFLLNVFLAIKDKYSLSLFAAHVNHGLRGIDADNDERFCKEYCQKVGVPIFVKKSDVAELAEKNGQSLEVAGRCVRYAFFDELCKNNNIKKIATAHNSDDNVETVLMRFLRGTGLLGLCGIPRKNKNIIRPILDISRKEIEEYLAQKAIEYVTDSTNLTEEYTRNKLRLSLIPKIEAEINSGFKKRLNSNILLYNDASNFLEEKTDVAFSECVLQKKFYAMADIKKLNLLHEYMRKNVLKKIVEKFGAEASYDAINSCLYVLEGFVPKVCLCGGVIIKSAYGKAFFYKDLPGKFYYDIHGEFLKIKETGATISCSRVDKLEKNAGKNVFFADADKLGTLLVRSRRELDSFCPTGKDEITVRLKDFFINAKIPDFLRDCVPLVVSDGEIVWIAGMRGDRRFAADDKTKNILKLEIVGGIYDE